MSLLLQALKRAEEAKRQKTQGTATDTEASTTPFPTLEEPSSAPEPSEPASSIKLETPSIELSTASAAPTETPAEPKLETAPASTQAGMVLEFESPAPQTTPVETLEPAPSEVAAEVPSAAPVHVTAKPTPTPQAEPTVKAEKSRIDPEIRLAAESTPAASTPAANTEAARQLLAAPRAKRTTSTLPWLVLAGCILISGLGAWFWWQFQQITAPTHTQLSAPIFPPATDPQPTADATETPADNPPVAVASAPTSSVAVLTPSELKPSSAAPAPQTPSRRAVPAARPAKTVANPSTSAPERTRTDVASYLEPTTAPRSNLPRVEKRVIEAAIPAPLENAWNAYQAGDLNTAEQEYRRMLSIDPRNRDAQLGLAAIAVRRGKKAEAVVWYNKLLQLNPQDLDARTGLAAVDAGALSENDENRLLQSADRAGTPLALGQYYAERQRWHEAQEQFFIAYSREPNSADLAFNLAVSLEHIQQSKLAADYYRKALNLKGGSFDRSLANKRIDEIMSAQ